MLTPTASLLTEKVAIVTGGGGGIGKAISQTYAAYGAKVVVAEIERDRANETVREIRDAGGEALAVVTDVRVREQVAAMADAAFDSYGRVDILVNNVGDYLQISKPFLESTEDEWQQLYDVDGWPPRLSVYPWFVPGNVDLSRRLKAPRRPRPSHLQR